eukprot:Skav216491  [mRNA]  locus=scaffold1123:495739:496074:- [translate_table: standard]
MPLPRPKVVQNPAMAYPQYTPQYVPGYPGGYPAGYAAGYGAGYPGYPGMWQPVPEPEIEIPPQGAPLKALAAAMGSRVTEDMLRDLPKATFAEASRLLLAVLGFMCEGAES